MGCGTSKTSIHQFSRQMSTISSDKQVQSINGNENLTKDCVNKKVEQQESRENTRERDQVSNSQEKPFIMDAKTEMSGKESVEETKPVDQGQNGAGQGQNGAGQGQNGAGQDGNDQGPNTADNVPKNPPKMTPEELRSLYEKQIAKTRELISNIMDKEIYTEENIPTGSFRSNLLSVGKIYYSMKVAPKQDIAKFRQEVAQIFLDTNFLNCLCRFMLLTLKEKKYKDSEGNVVPAVNNPLKTGLSTVLNFTDAVPSLCEEFCRVEGFLDVFRSSLEDMYPAHRERDQGIELTNDDRMLKSILGIVHNIGMYDPCVPHLQSHNYTPVLLFYMDSKLDMCRLAAIAALADILDEKESDLLQSHKEGIKFLIKIFGKSLKNSQHKEKGWSSKELGRTVGRLARNDANKKMLVEEGALPLLLELFKSDDTEEEKEAIESMWVLAFDEDNKQRMMEEPGLMEAVVDKYHSSADQDIRKPCQGLLWNLRDILLQSQKYADIGKELSGSSTKSNKGQSEGQKSKGHVMISYQWANQEVLIKVKDCLKQNGYDVWMDIDNMGGSTLQAMAEAIENASVVLMAMSRRYKDSPNCRAEAEYAFSKRKPIVPLVMELGYRPDGWLGMILGAKLFFDFSGKYSFDSKVDGLKKELGRSLSDAEPGLSEDVVDAGVVKPVTVAKTTAAFRSPAVKPDADPIKLWTSADVAKWLTKHNLHGEKLKKLTGREIAFLQNLRYEAPEFFYHTVETKLAVTDLLGLVNFTEAMDDLTS
ncbi:uncharacterized protein [Haliotis cracherodii]|uniref:uncharacterized protein n=1 Tax=Haliotis cracherodii TaxID=6455 RepID=UPI0039E93B83